MTLFETFCLINRVAAAQPNINTIVNTGDVFSLNTNNTTVKYASFCAQQGEHRREDNGFITYNFNLFYVDRLTDDSRNKLEIQSVAISTLQNIINGLVDIELIDVGTEVTFQTFTERFAAEAAGAYCNLSITTVTPICYQEYVYRIGTLLGDFNYDFSNDFFVKLENAPQ